MTKFIINNKMKSYGRTDTASKIVEINRKKHKGDREELADTIRHELVHVKHPNMSEKMVYKKTTFNSKSISPSEQTRLISKLESESITQNNEISKRRLAIMGLV